MALRTAKARCNKAAEQRVRDGRRFKYNGKNYLLINRSSSLFEVSDRFVANPGTPEILRQISILERSGYICSCTTYPKLNLSGLVMNVAHACNIACDYCCVGQGTYNGTAGLMNEETALESVDYLVRNSLKEALLNIRFFGGEPLLNMDVIKKTISYCKEMYPERRITFGITTNGILVNDNIAIYFRDNFSSNVVISLDGNREDHDRHRKNKKGAGTWDEVVRGIRILEKHGVPYIINCVVSKGSSMSLREHETTLKESFPKARVTIGYDYDRVRNNPNELTGLFEYIYGKSLETAGLEGTPMHRVVSALLKSPSSHNLYCGYGMQYLAVSSKGELYLCPDSMMFAKEEFKYHKTGTLSKGLDFERMMPVKCRTCWAYNLCGKGCHMRNILGVEPEDQYCEVQFRLIEKAVENISKSQREELYKSHSPNLYRHLRDQMRLMSALCPDITPMFLYPCEKCRSEPER